MNTTHFDTLIIGAGISGISAAHYMQADCPNKTYAILEGRKNIGGTWDLFRYPGIRSDSDMHTFGFSFKPWTNAKSISDGESIRDYLKEAVAEYGVKDKIRFGHKVVSANWDSARDVWCVSLGSCCAMNCCKSALVSVNGIKDERDIRQSVILLRGGE